MHFDGARRSEADELHAHERHMREPAAQWCDLEVRQCPARLHDRVPRHGRVLDHVSRLEQLEAVRLDRVKHRLYAVDVWQAVTQLEGKRQLVRSDSENVGVIDVTYLFIITKMRNCKVGQVR